MKNIKYVLFFLALNLIACAKSKSIEGLWQLASMEIKDGKTNAWTNWKDGTQGYLLYDANNHVSLHLTTGNYDNFLPNFPNFTDTIPLLALKHLTNNYNYTGTYKIKNGVIMHKKLSHSNPSEWGDTAFRKFWFKGDTLIMTPVEEKNARLRLKWVLVD